jgi:hypothetical protein
MWLDRINKRFWKRKMPERRRKALRQAVTFVTVQTLEVSTIAAAPTEDVGAGASAAAETASIGSNSSQQQKRVSLLSSNFKAHNLPADSPLFQLVYGARSAMMHYLVVI